jgi:dolichol-phosphate mannosyltransferase
MMHSGPVLRAKLPGANAIDAAPAGQLPELSVIVPTLNEHDNIPLLLARLERSLADVRWEVLFVDDDSGDGTAELLGELARSRPHVRYLIRVGRRGLASACIEGMLATAAPILVVMDADLQHDEAALPAMLRTIRDTGVDIVVGTRSAAAGEAGLTPLRLEISRIASLLSRLVVRAELSDPMSGFFMIRREFFEATVHHLSGTGFKILLDLFASAPRPARFAEVRYRFRRRLHGQSKLDSLVVLEYLWLLADKLVGRRLPPRFVMFVMIGSIGLLVHLGVLAFCYKLLQIQFYYSQALATLTAMTLNFNFNNVVTHRDRRLRGRNLLWGHLSFYLVCSVGAVVNFQIADLLYRLRVAWPLAGLLGAMVGAVWNYAVSSVLTWRRQG